MITRNRLFTLIAAAIVAGSTGAWAAGERTGTTGADPTTGAGAATGGERAGEGTGATGETVGRPDAWITTKVKSALLADQATSGLDVKVETQDGVVQLSGFVGSETEKQRAETVAQGIEGVKKVKNDIRLKAD